MNDLKNYLKGLALFTVTVVLLILTSCAKEEMDVDPYTLCHEEFYSTGGQIAVLECVYGKSAYDIMMDGSIEFMDRSVAMKSLNLDPHSQDPLVQAPIYTVEIQDAISNIVATDGYSSPMGNELEFYAEAPEYGKFIEWDVNHTHIGRDSGPRSNPIKVEYKGQGSDRVVEMTPRYKIYPEACPGGCDTELWIDNLTQPNQYQDDNGYHHIEANGNYFTVKNQVAELDEEYIVNGIPTVRTEWDSDYFMILENLQFSVSYYKPFGGYWTQGFGTLIAALHTTISLSDILGIYGITNAVGYTIDDNTCDTCPYSETLEGVRTFVNARTNITQRSILLNQDMKGDTLTVYSNTEFAYDNLYGRNESVKDSLMIVVH